jgi:hypothetical protein
MKRTGSVLPSHADSQSEVAERGRLDPALLVRPSGKGLAYHYAHRPDAVLLYTQGNFKMIVEDDVFDLQR